MELSIAGIGLILLALAILGIGATVLWFWSGGGGRKVLGVVVIGLSLVGVGLMIIGSSHSRVVRYDSVTTPVVKYATIVDDGDPAVIDRRAVPSAARVLFDPASVSDSRGPWPVEIDPKFKPDIYPSETAAARGLARGFAEGWSKSTPAAELPTSIRVFGEVDASVLQAAAWVLTQWFPKINVLVGNERVTASRSIAGADAREARLRISEESVTFEASVVRERSNAVAMGRSQHRRVVPDHRKSGTLRMEIRSVGGMVSRSARFVDKPWVDGFAEFASRDPSRHWMVAYSPQPCTSRHEAERSAMRDAAQKLAPEVRGYIKPADLRLWSVRVSDSSGRMDPSAAKVLESTIEKSLVDRECVSDRFVQSFRRPYGQVWREAVLVSASPESLTMLARDCEASLNSAGRSWAQTVGSIGGLFLMIIVVYLFLNAATKGYYVWSLRIATVVLVLVVARLALSMA